MKDGVSFNILTYNDAAKLLGCVDILRPEIAALGGAGQIIVVDDGSTMEDAVNALSYLEQSGVIVLRKDHDLKMPESWAHNINRAMRRSDFDIPWHFDDDTRIEGAPGWAGRTARHLRENKSLGVCAPRRIGIMEPFVMHSPYVLSFGLTEPCFAMRYETFVKIGPLDESLLWFFGPDYALRIMEAGLECGFDLAARQIDLRIRTGEPAGTFSRASGDPFYEKWTRYYGCGENEWRPFVRHHERIRHNTQK